MVGWRRDDDSDLPSVLGVRQRTRDAADEFHRAGHEVHIVDIFEGRTFDTYPPAMAFAWRSSDRLRCCVAPSPES